MATRRSRLQIKPNLGPKVGKLTPARSKSTSSIVTPIENNVPVVMDKAVENENVKQNTETSLTVLRIPKSQSTIETASKPSPLKSPNQSENNVGKALYKPESSVIRGFRNRLPKAKPNITPRGASRPTPNKLPVKTTPVDKTVIANDQPDSVCTAPNGRKKATSDDLAKPAKDTVPVIQDENRPVPMENDDTCSVISETVSEITSHKEITRERRFSGSPIKSERPLKKRRNTTYRRFPENEPPDRQKMKMSDMIYWNPTSNPMKQSNKIKKVLDTSKTDTGSPSTNDKDTITSSPVKDADDTSNDSMPVPQVTVGPDGSMIINEQSLVIETEKDTNHETTSQFEVSVEDDDMFVNYNSFRNKGPTKSWFDNETARFYRALSCLGTDFSLMSSLFPHRSRRELKNKFKREEKYNRKLVDAAIRNRTPLNLENFESIESVLEKDKQDRELKRKKNLKRKRSEKKTITSESKEKKHKENEDYNGTTRTPKSKPEKKKSPKKAKNKITKAKKSKTKGDEIETTGQPSVKTINKVDNQDGFSEYEFEDETEPLPARLPRLKKSSQFKEFRNTSARRLRNSQSQPVSEDDDESDEDEEVDVIDSDSDFVGEQEDEAADNEQPIKNSVSQPVNDEPMETCVSPIPQTQDSVIIDTQASVFSDCSQELPCESVNMSQMSPTSSPESDIMDTQEGNVSNFTTTSKTTFSPFKPLKPPQPVQDRSPDKSVKQKLKTHILSPVQQLLASSIKTSSKSQNQQESPQQSQPMNGKSPEKTVKQKLSPPKNASSLRSQEHKKDGKSELPSEKHQENANDKTVSKESTKVVKPSKPTNTAQETASQKTGNAAQKMASQKSTDTTQEMASQKSTDTTQEMATQKSTDTTQEMATQKSTNTAQQEISPQSQKAEFPKRTVELKKPVVGKSTIIPTQLLSRRKKFQPNINIQRKKTQPVSEKSSTEALKESEVIDNVELNNTGTTERAMSPRIGIIKDGATPSKTESEKLQILCQSQPVSDNDSDDDENDEVDIIDCDALSDDGQPIMNIVKTEPGLEHTVEEQQVEVHEHVQELDSIAQNNETDNSEHVESISDKRNLPSTSSGHDSISASNTNTSITTSPNLTSGLRTVKNKSKTTPISQRYQKQNSESVATLPKDKIDLTKRIVLDSSVITEGSPHFVLPANVFPNLPFNQGEEKMQMVLVPETKDGETIYHVYMLPEADDSKNTDSPKNSNSVKETVPS